MPAAEQPVRRVVAADDGEGPEQSTSASSEVTSAAMSFSGVCDPWVATETLSLEPILTPDFSTTIRPGSRKRSMTASGSRRLQST